MKGLEEDSLSHLFFSFHLRPKEAKEEGKCATAWGEEVAPEELVLESPLPISISPTSLVGDGVWVWVLRKENTLRPPPAPACSPKLKLGQRASGRRCRGRVLLVPTGEHARARDSSENPRHRRNRRNWLQLVKMPGICTLLCDLKQK